MMNKYFSNKTRINADMVHYTTIKFFNVYPETADTKALIIPEYFLCFLRLNNETGFLFPHNSK